MKKFCLLSPFLLCFASHTMRELAPRPFIDNIEYVCAHLEQFPSLDNTSFSLGEILRSYCDKLFPMHHSAATPKKTCSEKYDPATLEAHNFRNASFSGNYIMGRVSSANMWRNLGENDDQNNFEEKSPWILNDLEEKQESLSTPSDPKEKLESSQNTKAKKPTMEIPFSRYLCPCPKFQDLRYHYHEVCSPRLERIWEFTYVPVRRLRYKSELVRDSKGHAQFTNTQFYVTERELRSIERFSKFKRCCCWEYGHTEVKKALQKKYRRRKRARFLGIF